MVSVSEAAKGVSSFCEEPASASGNGKVALSAFGETEGIGFSQDGTIPAARVLYADDKKSSSF